MDMYGAYDDSDVLYTILEALPYMDQEEKNLLANEYLNGDYQTKTQILDMVLNLSEGSPKKPVPKKGNMKPIRENSPGKFSSDNEMVILARSVLLGQNNNSYGEDVESFEY